MALIKGWFFVSLREAKASDAPKLEAMYAQKRFKNCCMYKPEVAGSQFVAESESEERYLHVQYMILLAGRVIGTVYAYGRDPRDGHTFIAVYVESLYEWLGCAAEATALLGDHLFRTIEQLKEIRFEVYEHSTHSLQCLRTFGLKERLVAGKLRPHGESTSKLYLFSVHRRNIRRYAAEALRRGVKLDASYIKKPV